MTLMMMIERKLKKKIKMWRADPVLMVKDWFKATPTEEQAKILRTLAKPGSKVAVKAGHNTGKTTLAAWAAFWHVLLFDDSKIAATAPSASQLRDVLMAEIGKWYNRANDWVKGQFVLQTMRLSARGKESTQFLSARTARKEAPDALQGFHARHMLYLCDEAFGIPDQIYEVSRGALATKDARCLLIGNPTVTSGYAYNAFHRNKRHWELFTLSCVGSSLVDTKYIEEMREEYGEESDIYKVRVLGQFPSASICQFLPTNLVDHALGQHLRSDQYNFAPVCLGVDVSYFGDDRSAIFLRQGLRSTLLGSWYDIDTIQLASMAARYEDEYNADAVFVDITGIGAGVVDRLRQLGRNPIGVYVGGNSSKEVYLNKRAECWGNLKDWLRSGGVLPSSDDLREELISIQFGYTDRGKMQLERKADIKKRGFNSPDLADALALTFAEPVYKANDFELYNTKPNRVQTEYSLLG